MLPKEQWALIEELDLNVFYDDGEGYINCSLFTLHLSGPYGSEAEKGLYSHPLRFAYRTKRNEDGRKQGCGYTVGGFHGKSAKNCEFVGDKTYFSTVFPCFLQSFTVK